MVTLSDQFYRISMAGAFPDSQMGKEGHIASLIALSVFVIPYLWVLSRLIEADGFAKGSLVMQIGVRAALLSLVFIWVYL